MLDMLIGSAVYMMKSLLIACIPWMIGGVLVLLIIVGPFLEVIVI